MLPPDQHKLTEARRETTMSTARLEHAILQAVINYNAEHQLPREQIVMALINVAGYWQKKAITSMLSKRYRHQGEQ